MVDPRAGVEVSQAEVGVSDQRSHAERAGEGDDAPEQGGRGGLAPGV